MNSRSRRRRRRILEKSVITFVIRFRLVALYRVHEATGESCLVVDCIVGAKERITVASETIVEEL